MEALGILLPTASDVLDSEGSKTAGSFPILDRYVYLLPNVCSNTCLCFTESVCASTESAYLLIYY